MFSYRITLKKYSTKLVAPGIAGRWNGSGRKVIYCAESVAIAFLENMIRRQGVGFNDNFKTMILQIPDDLEIQTITANDLPAGWREFTDYSKCQPIGNAWYDDGTIPLLKVPSAVLPESFNYVINSLHPDFKKVKILKVTDLIPDERLEDLLKKYRNP
ncbi:MAG: RES family NAD+ phosphorylase [Ferruginibacter sp.]